MSKKKPENINNHHDLEVSNTIFFLQNVFINATMYRIYIRNLRHCVIKSSNTNRSRFETAFNTAN